MERFGLDRLAGGGSVRLWHPAGCASCRNTGYRGRMAVAEFLDMGPEVERLIFARADQSAIEKAAIGQGMTTMFQAGLSLVVQGETTLQELTRSVRSDA